MIPRILTPIYSGVFDIPNAKCPPDRGSSDWVTDSLAPSFPSSPSSDRSSTLSSIGPEKFPNSIVYPPTPPLDHPKNKSYNAAFDSDIQYPAYPMAVSAPRAIPRVPPALDLPTPPLTPDDGHDLDGGSVSAISARQSNAALDFLSALFPRNALGALPFAKSVSISSPNLGQAVFDGVVLALPDKPKTLYVDGKNAAHVNLRERYVCLIALIFTPLPFPPLPFRTRFKPSTITFSSYPLFFSSASLHYLTFFLLVLLPSSI